MDHEVLVYKVDNPVQSSLVLILIQGSIHQLTLRSLSCNIQLTLKLWLSYSSSFNNVLTSHMTVWQWQWLLWSHVTLLSQVQKIK